MLEWKVTPLEAGLKLIPFLKKRLSSSLRSLRWLVEHNRCMVNGKVERFCSTVLKDKDIVQVIDKEEKKTGSILWQDDYLLLYNKSSEVATEKLHSLLSQQLGIPLFLVHRLDKDTSGILLFAKTEEAGRKCENLFRSRSIKKTYLAIVHGAAENEKGTVKNSLGPIKKSEGEIFFGPEEGENKKNALTHWTKIRSTHHYSYLRIRPITGITHQIRVHLSSMGHPIVGDRRYGSRRVEGSLGCTRTLLHAETLFFTHPFTGQSLSVFAPLPSDFAKALTIFHLKRKD